MSSSIGEFVNEIIASIKDSARNMTDERINEVVEDTNVKGIAKTDAALYEAGVEDSVIINLLQKHWQIYEDDATEALRYERTVKYPTGALRAYLTGQGLNSREIKDFMTNNKVGIKLSHDPNLWKLKPAELIDAVKENE